MKITDRARAKIHEYLHKNPGKVFLVAVTTGGCNGFQYKTDLVDKDALHILIEPYVVTDPASDMLLANTTLDYIDKISYAGFDFQNPDADGKCGCGKSFNV